MSLILNNNGIFPIFASEPSVQESGYRTRYNVQSTYSEIKPSTVTSKPAVYSFDSVTIPNCKEKQDWVSLLCMGTTPQTVPAKYVDRSRLLTDTQSITFEGSVFYQYSGGVVVRDPIRFFSTRPPRILPRVTAYNVPGNYTHTIDPNILYVDVTVVGAGGGVPVLSAINPIIHYAAFGGASGATLKFRLTKAQYGATRSFTVGTSSTSTAGGQASGFGGGAIANGGGAGSWSGNSYNNTYTSVVGAGALFSYTFSGAQATLISSTLGAGSPSVSILVKNTGTNPYVTLIGGNGASSTVGIGSICTQLALPGPLVSSTSNVQQPVACSNTGAGAAGGALWLGGALPTLAVRGGDGLVLFEEYYS